MRRATMRLRGIAVGVGGVILAAGCHYYYKTPPSHFTYAKVDSVPFDSIRSYARSLKYDTVIGAADSQRMDFATWSIGTGAWSVIEPERGAWALDTNELAEGRIVARIRSQAAYVPLGYGPWNTWWWVDRKGGHWRSLYLSDSLMTRVQDSVRLTRHGTYEWRQSIARWGSQWSTCSKSACCDKQ
ncbi:MAG TPA: hypothetical protein VGV12_11935 [Gemmatimonadales bacterium]|nr:hypothetical protein [Gemmatimonadales bacterium]